MHLVIFDIDGTLTDTMNLDDELYVNALKNTLDIDLTQNEWDHFKKISTGTDSGITREIFNKKLDYNWDQKASSFLKSSFLDSLANLFLKKPYLFKEILGAKDFINGLANYEGIKVGIATGSWKDSGIIKLNSIDINYKDFPFGHSDLYSERKDIIDHVIHDSHSKFGISNFSKITYIGDGIWDMVAAQELGINFIGVDSKNTGLLSNLGVSNVIRNYSDKELLYKLL
jgi:phosphoglycolate phosphatase-like HAD superfamily hydrolase